MNKLITRKHIILTAILFSMVVLPLLGARAETNIEILNIGAENIGDKTIEIKWSANTAARGKILYGESSDNLPYFITDSKASKYHSVKIGNLKEETVYYYQIAAYNNFGKVQSFVKKIKTEESHDKIPPKIKNARVAYVSGTVAVIRWETGEKASSKVEYGENGNYNKRNGNKKKTTDHLVIIKKLKPNTQYFLRLYSVDKDKNKSGFAYKEFTTRANGERDKEDLVISYLRPTGPDDSHISDKSIEVSFKTSRYAKGKITLKKKGTRSKTEILDYGLNHSVVFLGLSPNANYTIEVSMKDIFGKKAKEKFSAPTKKNIIYYREGDIAAGEQTDDIMVLGEESSYYTPIASLYKVIGSSRIYSIIKRQRHRVASPASFWEYGYDWSDIKDITSKALSKYPPVKLVKSPENAAIYYLYERPGDRLLKINIPSPSVFESYPGNVWANVVKVTQADIDAIASVKLIKTKDSPDVYNVADGIKRYVPATVFAERGFLDSEIMIVSQAHLDSYEMGENL